MRNEVLNVEPLSRALGEQSFHDFDWYVVDDGSDDGTLEVLNRLTGVHKPTVLSKKNDGGLIAGSAFSSWRRGVEAALASGIDYTHFMKLDADVRLAPSYLDVVMDIFSQPDVGLAGGIIVTPGMMEQAFQVSGPVKLYSRTGLDVVLQLPSAIGFDIMDQMILAKHGLRTVVTKSATYELVREVGMSEGEIHGRYRHGRGCRWTGYSFPYFLIRCTRYFLRRPYVIGPFAMFWGYCTAGPGPYDSELKRMHARTQHTKLREMFTNPRKFYRDAYSTKAD